MQVNGVSRRTSAGWCAILGVGVAVTVLGGCQGTQSAGADEAETQDALRALEQSRLQALVDVDMATLEEIHAPDFVLIPPPGFAMTREEYLAEVESGGLDYAVFEPISDIEVSVHGDAAVLTYQSRISIDAAGQGELEHEAWHTYVYEETDDGWRLTWEQATAVGGFPPA